jgi:fido (protein-threonine AMPylation protein)
VNISKSGHPFAACAFVEPALSNLLQELSNENWLRGLDEKAFVRRAAFYFGEN